MGGANGRGPSGRCISPREFCRHSGRRRLLCGRLLFGRLLFGRLAFGRMNDTARRNWRRIGTLRLFFWLRTTGLRLLLLRLFQLQWGLRRLLRRRWPGTGVFEHEIAGRCVAFSNDAIAIAIALGFITGAQRRLGCIQRRGSGHETSASMRA